MAEETIEAEMTVADVHTLAAQEEGTINAQVATAKTYPRSLKRFASQLESYSTASEDIALSCIYTLPRAGKKIQGPSIRFAELLQSTYGNLRVDGAIVDVGAKEIKAQGTALDLENNTGVRVQVTRRITNKMGQRFNEDMIQTTANAAISLAIRNAIIRIVPRALWEPIWDRAKEVALGDAESFSDRRDRAMEWLAKAGVPDTRVLAMLGRERVEDVTTDDVLTLRSCARQIKDGEASMDDLFPEPKPKTSSETKSAAAEAAEKALKGESEKKDE